MIARPLATGLAHGMIAAGVASDGFTPPAPTGDPDADGYIAEVIAVSGVIPTQQQADAIGAFIAAEKAGGRWTKHVRLYFPIWNHPDANSVCMKSLTRMADNGCSTSNGSIEGDGGTAYVDTQTIVAGSGMAVENCYIWVLATGEHYDPAMNYSMIGTGASAHFGLKVQFAIEPYLVFGVGGTAPAVAVFPMLGILSGSRLFGTANLYQRTSTERNMLVSDSTPPIQPLPDGNVLVFVNDYSDFGGGALGDYSSQAFGGFGFGLGLTDAQDAAFTANFKTLWETCTGLTIP